MKDYRLYLVAIVCRHLEKENGLGYSVAIAHRDQVKIRRLKSERELVKKEGLTEVNSVQ